jgi:hypothetical protein
VRSIDAVAKLSPIIVISVLDTDTVVLASLTMDDGKKAMLVITSVYELGIFPVSRERIADVSEFIVVSALIDDSNLAGKDIDVPPPFPVVVNNVDVLSKTSAVVDITLLRDD